MLPFAGGGGNAGPEEEEKDLPQDQPNPEAAADADGGAGFEAMEAQDEGPFSVFSRAMADGVGFEQWGPFHPNSLWGGMGTFLFGSRAAQAVRDGYSLDPQIVETFESFRVSHHVYQVWLQQLGNMHNPELVQWRMSTREFYNHWLWLSGQRAGLKESQVHNLVDVTGPTATANLNQLERLMADPEKLESLLWPQMGLREAMAAWSSGRTPNLVQLQRQHQQMLETCLQWQQHSRTHYAADYALLRSQRLPLMEDGGAEAKELPVDEAVAEAERLERLEAERLEYDRLQQQHQRLKAERLEAERQRLLEEERTQKLRADEAERSLRLQKEAELQSLGREAEKVLQRKEELRQQMESVPRGSEEYRRLLYEQQQQQLLQQQLWNRQQELQWGLGSLREGELQSLRQQCSEALKGYNPGKGLELERQLQRQERAEAWRQLERQRVELEQRQRQEREERHKTQSTMENLVDRAMESFGRVCHAVFVAPLQLAWRGLEGYQPDTGTTRWDRFWDRCRAYDPKTGTTRWDRSWDRFWVIRVDDQGNRSSGPERTVIWAWNGFVSGVGWVARKTAAAVVWLLSLPLRLLEWLWQWQLARFLLLLLALLWLLAFAAYLLELFASIKGNSQFLRHPGGGPPSGGGSSFGPSAGGSPGAAVPAGPRAGLGGVAATGHLGRLAGSSSGGTAETLAVVVERLAEDAEVVLRIASPEAGGPATAPEPEARATILELELEPASPTKDPSLQRLVEGIGGAEQSWSPKGPLPQPAELPEATARAA
jgi:hypothetical protein